MFRAIAVVAALTLPQAAAAQGLQLHVIHESLPLGPADVLSAEALNEDGRWVVKMRLAPDAAMKFGVLTERNQRKTMQLVLEDRILISAVIVSVIKRGELHIQGSLTEETAKELAQKIKAGGLARP
jgi:preprotein translocase subunit SecD